MDSIADMLIMIKNAQMSRKNTASVPYSKLKMEIAKVLKREKLIKEVEKKGKNEKTMEIILAYDENGNPVISNVKRVSKPSCRVYTQCGDIRSVKGGMGLQIITTPKGILTNKEARKEKVGGEILCEIW